jgi:hypothetical protein
MCVCVCVRVYMFELHVLLYQTNRHLQKYATFTCTKCTNIILLKSGSSGQVGAEGGDKPVPVNAMTACRWGGGSR